MTTARAISSAMRFDLISLILLGALTLPAQTLRVLSEFQRVDPFGEIIAVDRAVRPREILSPAVARNAFASFRIAVTARPNTSFLLYVQSYPPDVLHIAVYKERYRHSGNTWIPDVLEETHLPSFGAMPDVQERIPGQTTRSYWLDVWVPLDAIPGTMRLEVLIKSAIWVIHPMELRILRARVPNLPAASRGALPAVDLPADASALGPLEAHFAGKPPVRFSAVPDTVRSAIRRNAAQDMALAPPELLPELMQRLWRRMLDPWPNEGPEWYLPLRDLILRQASN